MEILFTKLHHILLYKPTLPLQESGHSVPITTSRQYQRLKLRQNMKEQDSLISFKLIAAQFSSGWAQAYKFNLPPLAAKCLFILNCVHVFLSVRLDGHDAKLHFCTTISDKIVAKKITSYGKIIPMPPWQCQNMKLYSSSPINLRHWRVGAGEEYQFAKGLNLANPNRCISLPFKLRKFGILQEWIFRFFLQLILSKIVVLSSIFSFRCG